MSGAGAVLLWRTGRRGSALGLAVVAAAAFLGVLRFGGVAGTAVWHDRLSSFAAAAAVPAFCWAFWRSFVAKRPPGWLVVAVLMALLYVVARLVQWPPYALAVGALGLLGAGLLGLVLMLLARSQDVPVVLTVPAAVACILLVMGLAAVSGLAAMRALRRADPATLLR